MTLRRSLARPIYRGNDMNYDAINDFMSRVKKLNKSNSKDLRLSYEEAHILAISIGELMSQLKQKADTTSIVSAPAVIDGGTFPKKG